MDSISNLLTSLRNAELADHSKTVLPHSKTSVAILEILKKNDYIVSYSVVEQKPQSKIEVTLQSGARHHFKRISKPGRRMYTPAEKIPTVLRGLGMVIISTSNGIISGQDARSQKVGGELLCEVY